MLPNVRLDFQQDIEGTENVFYFMNNTNFSSKNHEFGWISWLFTSDLSHKWFFKLENITQLTATIWILFLSGKNNILRASAD